MCFFLTQSVSNLNSYHRFFNIYNYDYTKTHFLSTHLGRKCRVALRLMSAPTTTPFMNFVFLHFLILNSDSLDRMNTIF